MPTDITNPDTVRTVLTNGNSERLMNRMGMNKAAVRDRDGIEWTLRAPQGGQGLWTAQREQDSGTYLVIDARTGREYDSPDGAYECRSADGAVGNGARWQDDGDREHHCRECPLNEWGSAPDGQSKACNQTWVLRVAGEGPGNSAAITARQVKMSPSLARKRRPWEKEPENGTGNEPEEPDRETQAALAALRKDAGAEMPGAVMECVSVDLDLERGELNITAADGRRLASLRREADGTLQAGQGTVEMTHLPGPDGRAGYRGLGKSVVDQVITQVAGNLLGRKLNPDGAPYDVSGRGWRPLRQAVEICEEHGREAAALRVAKEAAARVQPLIDREAREIAEDLHGQADVYKYNEVMKCPGPYRELARTNPGIAAWALIRNMGERDMNHPGQLLARVKGDMTESGLRPANWKPVSKMSPDTVRAARGRRSGERNCIMILNAIAETRTAPPPRAVAGPIHGLIDADRYARGLVMESDTGGPNLEKALKLLCKEMDGTDPEEQREIEANEIADYLGHLARENQNLTATNWNGVVKRTREWHEEVARDQRQAEDHAVAEMEAQGGRMARKWNSLLDVMSIGDLQVVPLLSGGALAEEARVMNHCVFGYDGQCVNGTSRIFSIRKEGERTATAELRMEREVWSAVQVRGNANRRVEDSVTGAARELARLYQEAWDITPDPRHRSWQAEPETP